MVDAFLAWAKQQNVISASFYTPFLCENTYAIYKRLFADAIEVNKFTSYVVLDEMRLSTSLQYDIRKAERSGVVVRSPESQRDVEDIYTIYLKNCVDYGIPPKPKSCLQQLITPSGSEAGTSTQIATFENKLMGPLIMIYPPSTASYYLPFHIH